MALALRWEEAFMVQHKMSLAARRELLLVLLPRYRSGNLQEKKRLLDQFVSATGCNRKYAIGLFNNPPLERKKPVTRPRARRYNADVQQALVKVWKAANGISPTRLVPFIPEMVEALERHGELQVAPETRRLLLSISRNTADRLLQAERKRFKHKGLSTTKPGTLLKHQIPIRTYADWDDSEMRPGFMEVDLVAHCGETAGGEYLYSLVITDVLTQWTECVAVMNKSQQAVMDAIKAVRKRLLFPLLGLDSDNGSEFINFGLLAYCNQEQITFTRSRPYKKNDQPHIEQKNFTVVRQTVGYSRYEGEVAYRQLNRLYSVLRLYINFFQPSMKLVSKERNGARVRKKYDVAQTPYKRVVAAGFITEEQRHDYDILFMGLNPVDLRNQIETAQEKLLKMPRSGS